MHALVGRVIAGKYRCDRVIGRGGTSVVVAATHVELGQPVAIKVLQAGASPEIAARFVRESRLSARLKSEHVARVLDAGQLEGGGEAFIIMEYLEGHDLRSLLQERGPLPVQDACDYVLQACEGLAEAHASKMVHRDIKPANLFLARGAGGVPTIKVLDFGISKAEHTNQTAVPLHTSADALLGTPYYMSPEQVMSARDVDARSDIWAIGVVLYELLVGRHAFEGKRVADVFAAIMDREPAAIASVRRDVPEDVARAIERCMRKNPNERHASLADFARALEPFGGPEASSHVRRVFTYLGLPWEETVPARRGPPLALSIAVAAMLGVVIVGGGVGAWKIQHRALATSAPPASSTPPTAVSLSPIGVPLVDIPEVPQQQDASALIVTSPTHPTTAITATAAASSGGANEPKCMADWARLSPSTQASDYKAIRDHGKCLMLAGHCDAGRAEVKRGYPPNDIIGGEKYSHNYAALYCPRDQISKDELIDRLSGQILTANENGDRATAIARAGEIEKILATESRTTAEGRKRINDGEWSIALGYARAGRCDDARRVATDRCALIGRPNTACVEANVRDTPCQ